MNVPNRSANDDCNISSISIRRTRKAQLTLRSPLFFSGEAVSGSPSMCSIARFLGLMRTQGGDSVVGCAFCTSARDFLLRAKKPGIAPHVRHSSQREREREREEERGDAEKEEQPRLTRKGKNGGTNTNHSPLFKLRAVVNKLTHSSPASVSFALMPCSLTQSEFEVDLVSNSISSFSIANPSP